MAKPKIKFEEAEETEIVSKPKKAKTSKKPDKIVKKAEKAVEKAIKKTEEVAKEVVEKTEDIAKKTIKEIEEQTEKIYEEIKELKAKAAPKVKQFEKKIVQDIKEIAKSQAHKESKVEGVSGLMQFKDWEKIDLRVAKIKKVEEIEGADKLYKLTLDVGELGTKVVCAGIKEHYEMNDLKGKKLIFFANLAPRMMKGINSQGMILAAVSKDHSQVVLIQPDKDINAGARVS